MADGVKVTVTVTTYRVEVEGVHRYAEVVVLDGDPLIRVCKGREHGSLLDTSFSRGEIELLREAIAVADREAARA